MTWHEDSPCRIAIRDGKAKREWWFPLRGGWSSNGRKAKAICEACPVKGECLAHALAHCEAGIWGGTNEGDRVKMRAAVRPEKLCVECGTAFVQTNGQVVTCSPPCWSVRKRRQQAAVSKRRRSNVMIEQGHGTISRYHAGCHCPACRRASRTARADLRAKAAS